MHAKEFVRGEGGNTIMSNDMEIEVSRRRKEPFISKVKESFKYRFECAFEKNANR